MNQFASLVASAPKAIDGQSANQWLWNERQRLECLHGDGFSYEVVLDESKPWSEFLENMLVRLLDHLEAKHQRPPGPPWMVVAVWSKEEMFPFEAPTFWDALAKADGSEREALIDRAQRWRAHRDALIEAEDEPPLLLTGPTE